MMPSWLRLAAANFDGRGGDVRPKPMSLSKSGLGVIHDNLFLKYCGILAEDRAG